MRKILLSWLCLLSCAAPAQDTAMTSRALLLSVAGAIGPATSDYIQRGIKQAHEQGYELVVLKLDTPGGLDTAMRDIIRAILASPLPVATYIAPSGARAASAGTYIMYASHIAAMAPATNLGAATPVAIGGLPSLPDGGKPESSDKEKDTDTDDEKKPLGRDAMTHKMVNDAVAYIKGLATLRGRNVEWAEQAVREAASLPAEEALERNVIDLIAVNERALLNQLDGRSVEIDGVTITLATRHMELDSLEPDWRTLLLSVIANPNIAYVLMLLGIYGLFFELANPGAIIPGVIGAICLLLAMFALQILPVNYAGLALILLGISFMIGELFVPSFGALGIGGTVGFVIGSVILFDTDAGDLRVSMSIIIALTIVTATFFLVALRALLKARRGPVVTGREQLIGSVGEVLEDFDVAGRIRVHSEMWTAQTKTPMQRGARVRVIGIDGLTLSIEPFEEKKP